MNSAMFQRPRSSTQRTQLYAIHESPAFTFNIPCSDNLVIGEIHHKNERAIPRQKNVEKLASQSIYSGKFHIYISPQRLYVARLRNITLPFKLGIHDDANQTSAGRTPSFSIFTS